MATDRNILLLTSAASSGFALSSTIFILLSSATIVTVNSLYIFNRANLENPDTANASDFYELLKNELFVDKSPLIEYYLKHEVEIACITRPKGWGKTTNLNMLKTFFEVETDDKGVCLPPEKRVNRKLFVGGEVNLNEAQSDGERRIKSFLPLKIAFSDSSMEHQGRYPVIHADFGQLTGSTAGEIVGKLKILMSRLYDRHRYLADNDSSYERLFASYRDGTVQEKEVTFGLRTLSTLLHRHFGQKVVVLIDDYDTPLKSLYGNLVRRNEQQSSTSANSTSLPDIFQRAYCSKDFDRVFNLLWSILENGLQNNSECLWRAVLTGTFVVPFGNAFGGFNEIVGFGVQDEDFSRFYGFSEDEVNRMLTNVTFRANRDKVRHWYGYSYKDGQRIVYNPWSIRHFVANRGTFRTYWIEDDDTITDYIFRLDDIQQKLHNLADGKPVWAWVSEGIEYEAMIDWSVNYLVFVGYLKANSYGFDDKPLTVPNQEIANLLKTKIASWVYRNVKIDDKTIKSLADPLMGFKMKIFQRRLQDVLPRGGFPSSVYYKGVMKCLVYSTEGQFVKIKRNLDHRGPNAILVSKPSATIGAADDESAGQSAIVIKYKIIKNPKKLRQEVQNELQRINDNMPAINLYDFEHIKHILKLAVVFCGDQLDMEYQIDNI